jgi:hypothetical protein
VVTQLTIVWGKIVPTDQTDLASFANPADIEGDEEYEAIRAMYPVAYPLYLSRSKIVSFPAAHMNYLKWIRGKRWWRSPVLNLVTGEERNFFTEDPEVNRGWKAYLRTIRNELLRYESGINT